MLSPLLTTILPLLLLLLLLHRLFSPRPPHVPGPPPFRLSKWRLAYSDYLGTRTRLIHRLHKHYGPILRIGPTELHFNSATALRTIYGAGSGFERTGFYAMFRVYGRENLFTLRGGVEHGRRKKLLAHAYAKSVVLKGGNAEMVEGKVERYLQLVERNLGKPHEVFASLHWFALDNITHFLYGPIHGGTSAVEGDRVHRRLLNDIVDPSRRRLSWFAVHLPALTKWLYTRTGLVEKLVAPFLPMAKPATYTGIRAYALQAYYSFSASASAFGSNTSADTSVLSELSKHHISSGEGPQGVLDDVDMASECADHLLAGIDTTSDTLTFLLWSLSLPRNSATQTRLRSEVLSLPASALNANGIPKASETDKLPFLDAVIRETLRLYAPLPASEPRVLPARDCVIDGVVVPRGTVVSVAPYSLHRNPEVFEEPERWWPERWLGPEEEVREMRKWWVPFSMGGRSCIGVHLAMAEMTTLVAALYRNYSTELPEEYRDKSPAVTSRFELFFDETMEMMEEHTCYINFHKLKTPSPSST